MCVREVLRVSVYSPHTSVRVRVRDLRLQRERRRRHQGGVHIPRAGIKEVCIYPLLTSRVCTAHRSVETLKQRCTWQVSGQEVFSLLYYSPA